MPSWIGNVIGSAIGLIAILLGALWNASLTRKRDRIMMQDEAKAIATAIGSELAVYVELLCGRMLQAAMGPEGRSEGLLKSLVAPPPVVWPALAPKVGLLGADLCAKTVRAWAYMTIHVQMLDATVSDMLAGDWSEKVVRSRRDMLAADMPAILDAIEALTGARPDLTGLLP